MGRRLMITAGEMLEMRKRGMSNHDIAKSLEISVPTVLRYIGKQGKKMDGLAAFNDTKPTKKEEAKAEVKPVIPKYDPKPVFEQFQIGECIVELDRLTRIVTIGTKECGDIEIPYANIPDLVQFLAWAMRERMEVKADAEDQLQAEGCEV